MKIFRGRKELKEGEKREAVRIQGLKLPYSKREDKKRTKKKKKKGKGRKEEDEHVVAYI
jgi:hypothetical protein